jgi:hypothetical protein
MQRSPRRRKRCGMDRALAAPGFAGGRAADRKSLQRQTSYYPRLSRGLHCAYVTLEPLRPSPPQRFFESNLGRALAD